MRSLVLCGKVMHTCIAIKICGSLLYSMYLVGAECSSFKKKFLSLDQLWDGIAIMPLFGDHGTNVSRYKSISVCMNWNLSV